MSISKKLYKGEKFNKESTFRMEMQHRQTVEPFHL